MPVIIQSIVYRMAEQGVEVLLLKRTEERGGFWNVVNGTLEYDESAINCRERELCEETGIVTAIRWSDELHRFSFSYKGDTFVTVVFAAQVAEDQQVVINDEHTEFRWVGMKEAIEMLKFDDDKNGLRKLQENLGAAAD